jgi:mycothiol synthase
MITEIVIPISVQLPLGCSARAGKLSDYSLLFHLVNTYSQYINGHNDLNDPELIRLDWLNRGFNPETDIHTVFGPDGSLVGHVESWLTNKPPVHPWNWVCVHPEYLDKNIWEYLLRWAENRSRAALDLVPSELRVSSLTGTEHHNRAGIQIIQKLGWRHIRSYYRMATDLDTAPEVPPTPAGIVIRPYHPLTETEAVYHAFIDSFKDHFGFVERSSLLVRCRG